MPLTPVRAVGLTLAVVAALAAPATLARAARKAPKLPDVALWDRALGKHVKGGQVDYASWKTDRADLDRYLAQAVDADPFSLPEGDEKKAFWINFYNACTIALVLDNYPLKSLRELDHRAPVDPRTKKKGNVFDLPVCVIGNRKLSLNEVENKYLRWVKDAPEVPDPRIHFALVCASSSCPFLQNRAFTARQLHKRLEDAARNFFSDRRNFKVNEAKKEIQFSRLLDPDWLGKDFTGPGQKSLLDAIARWLRPEDVLKVQGLLAQGYKVTFFDYDWNLNGR